MPHRALARPARPAHLVPATTPSPARRAWASVLLAHRVRVTILSPARRAWASGRPLATFRARRLLAPVRRVPAGRVRPVPVNAAVAQVVQAAVVPVVASSAPAAARVELAALALPAGDWRRDWSAGLIELACGEYAQARAAFDAVYDALPGEPVARLALAAACELAGDRDAAFLRYLRVWRVDRGVVSAASS